MPLIQSVFGKQALFISNTNFNSLSLFPDIIFQNTQMSSSSILETIDRVSQKYPLNGKRSSWIGCVGTLMILALCLGLYVPAVISYFSGNYYQSMFETDQNFYNIFYSRDDFKLAIVLRNKQNGSVYNHTKLFNIFQSIVQYINYPYYYYEPLQLCDKNYFANDINGVVLQDCLIIPDFVEYDAGLQTSLSSIYLQVAAPPAFQPFPRTKNAVFASTHMEQIYTNVLTDYYCEFYFTSKVLTSSGTTKFQLHKVYSTEINVGSETIGANMSVQAGLRVTLMDDSIMPWRNYQNITTMSYSGNHFGTSALTIQQAANNGFQNSFTVMKNMQIAVRFYKKIDWLVGIIGGGIFLFYIIFRVVFNYINRWLMKLQLVNQQLLLKVTSDNPRDQNDLIQAKIPLNYMLKRIIPYFKNQNYEKILLQSENNNDIVLLIKKLKVTLRNLKRKQLLPDFRHKMLKFQFLEKENQLSNFNQVQSGYSEGISIQIRKNEQNQQKKGRQNNPIIIPLQSQELFRDPSIQQQNRKSQKQQKIEAQQFDQEQQQSEPKQEKLPKIQYLFDDRNNPPLKKKQNMATNIIVLQNQKKIINNNHQAQQIIIINNPGNLNYPLGQQLNNGNNPDYQQDSKKFNISLPQMEYLKESGDIGNVFENNPLFSIMLKEKPESYFDDMQMEEYDKWQGNYTLKLKKCSKKCSQFLISALKKCDFFSVRVNLLDRSHSSSCCGILLTILILSLSILTFVLTLVNIKHTQYIISENYVPIDNISFNKQTDNNFNAVICFSNSNYFTGANKYALLTLFAVTNGVTQNYTAVQMTSSDPVLNLQMSNSNNCFKFPNGASINMNSGSYFGFTITPYCSGTPQYCSTNQVITNNNFITAVTKNPIQLILPGSRFDPQTNKLVTGLFTIPKVNQNSLKMNVNMYLEQTAYASQVRLYDDSGISFMHNAPILKDNNLNINFNTRRTYVKASISSQPTYVFKIKLNQASTDYTVTQKKIDQILGIIGGVFVFWYAIIHTLKYCYWRFNFNAYIAKLIYDQQGYDDYFIYKIFAMLRIPRCLMPSCGGLRQSICRMKQVHDKVDNTLSHLTLLKYTDNCFRLSTSFFSKLETKMFSTLYFRQKILENQIVTLPIAHQQINIEFQEQQQVELNEEIKDKHLGRGRNKVHNKAIEDELVNEQKIMTAKVEQQIVKQSQEYQDESQNVIDGKVSKCSDYFDIFDQPTSFAFKGERTFSSVTGGICCLIMLLFILILCYYTVIFYLIGGGQTTSYDIIMDDGPTSSGLTLTTGKNFKIGVNFMSSTTMMAINPASYLQTVGISLLLQQYTRKNGIVVPSITTVDLVLCPQGYIESWVTPNVDITYFSGLNYAYCAPDQIKLQISGLPEDLIRNNFKLSIYNKAGSAAGLNNLTELLNTTFVMLHFSSPRQNSFSRTVDYSIQSILFPYFGGQSSLLPFQTNITFSKSNVTYDDTRNYQASLENQLTYRFEPFLQQMHAYNYYGANNNLWFNISFSYSQKVYNYNITTPKFYQIFGIIGGVIAIFYFFVGCFTKSFNEYKLRYEIGKELYQFDMKRITQTKQKIKKKLRKSPADKQKLKKINDLSELSILKAYLLVPLGSIINNFNFNQTLRIVTLIQDRVSNDLDIAQFYKNLFRARQAINSKLKEQGHTRFNLSDIYFKKVANLNPIPYTYDRLQNYIKLHKLSSYEQMIVYRAARAKINIKEVLDNKQLQDLFNVIDEASTINLGMMNDTQNSFNSSSMGSLNQSSIGEQSVTAAAETQEEV